MSDLLFGEWVSLGTAFCWTLSALAWTSAGKDVGALAVSFIRLVIACVLMIIYEGVFRGFWLPTDADARTWLLLGISGFFGFFLCDICLFKAMLMIGPRLALLLFSLMPPTAALISWAFAIDVLTPLDWAAMGVTLAGVVWVVLEQPNQSGPPPPSGHRMRGVVLGILSAVANAIGLVFAKEGIGHYDPVAATLIRALAAMPGYFLLITLWRRWPTMLAAVRQRRAMFQLTLGAIVGPFVGVVLNMLALSYAPTGVVATIISTMPVMIIPFSVVVYHEKVGLRAVGGAIVAVAGVAMLMLL